MNAQKILDGGPWSQCLNVLLAAEGFTQMELPVFRTACDDFVRKVQSEPWYKVLERCALNLFRLDVVSEESARRLIYACPPRPVKTAFKAMFCAASQNVRYLSGEETLAREAAKDAGLGKPDAICVLVNSSFYGASGREEIAWTALHSRWDDTLLHELGHSLFGLADEYSELEYKIDQGEPSAPNLTSETDRAKLKWRHLVEPSTPIPTQTNPDPTRSNYRPSPVAANVVGLFEGGGRYHSKVFRPAYRCKMRSTSDAFCMVCVEAILKRFSELRREPEPSAEGEEHQNGRRAEFERMRKNLDVAMLQLDEIRISLKELAEAESAPNLARENRFPTFDQGKMHEAQRHDEQ